MIRAGGVVCESVSGECVGAGFLPLSSFLLNHGKELFGRRGGRNSLETGSWGHLLGLSRKNSASNQSTQETAPVGAKAFHLIGGLGTQWLPFIFSLLYTEASPGLSPHPSHRAIKAGSEFVLRGRLQTLQFYLNNRPSTKLLGNDS